MSASRGRGGRGTGELCLLVQPVMCDRMGSVSFCVMCLLRWNSSLVTLCPPDNLYCLYSPCASHHSPVLNVSLGLWQYSTLAYGQLDNSRYYPFWVWIVFLIVYTFWDSFLFVYSKWIGPRLNKMWKKKEKEFEMRPTNADPKDKEDPPKKEPSKVEC